jgi:L-alanine-DL-glutamate epimerase-like enolase superfamily enzyme
MKITDVELWCVDYPLKHTFYPSWLPNYPQNSHRLTLIRINTDEGIKGISAAPAFYKEYKEIASLIAPFLFGRDPFNVEEIIRILRNATYLGLRLWFIEVALWDIIGKATNQPVYKLLGGFQNRIKAYASTGEVRDAKRRVEDVLRFKEEGFKAVKLRFHSLNIKDDLKTAEKVREAVGDEMEIMIDANQAWRVYGMGKFSEWTVKDAIFVAKELKNLDVKWLEEPLEKYNYAGLKELRESVDIPIAGGEMNSDIYEFRDLIKNRCYDIIQPDVTMSCGILNAKKIAGFAEMEHLQFCPHTWTNGIGLAANLQIMGAVNNCYYAEFPYEIPAWTPEVRDFLLKEYIKIEKDGYINIPDKPGIGVEIDEDKLKKYGERSG